MRKLLLVLVPVVLAGCGDLFSVHARAKEVCVRRAGQTLPGIGALAAAPASSTALTVDPASVAGTDPAPSVAPATSPVPAAGSAPLVGSIFDVFALDVGDIADFQKEHVGAALGMQSFTMAVPSGVLAGLERLRVHVDPPPGSDLPPLTLAEFPPTIGGAVLKIEGDTITVDLSALDDDLLKYVQDGKVDVVVDAAGELPVEEWSADVEVCASADASYDYGEKLGL